MKSFVLPGVVLVFQFTVLLGCASIPGSTGEEQAEVIADLVQRTLADLDKQEPNASEVIASSVGYAIMNNKITKIPLVGAGSGYGVAINTKTGEKTYIKMVRFDVGGGWGARAVRPVVVFRDEKKFKNFIKGEFVAHAGAEAAAKVGEAGAAGGRGSGASDDKGYVVYLITDTGVSATVTAGVIHVRPIELIK